MLFRGLLYTGVIVWLFCAQFASALTLAVFPVEDLSQGVNGVNYEVTEYLSWDMDRRGFDVLAKEQVILFMGRNRIRSLGFLDTRQILLVNEELGADLVLYGTTYLSQRGISPSLGLTLYLVRTSDAKTLWTGTGGVNPKDIVNLLAIGEQEIREGLMPRLAQNVLSDWPEDLNFSSEKQHALEIEGTELTPVNVRRGEKVFCKVNLRRNWSEVDAPRIFFKASGQVYRAKYFEKASCFSAEWEVSEADGNYPVTMVINWPSGYKKVAYLGSYRVDSLPPQLVLDLKGVMLEGAVAFRDQIIIIPRMLRREPVARWHLTVEDEFGEEQMSQKGYGKLPQRFVWNGNGKTGWPVEEGIYKVTLKAWDRADNMAVTSQPVAVARTPPSMVLEAKNSGRDMIVDLSHDGRVPIAFWRVEMRTSEGELLQVAEGSELPVRMDVRVPKRVIEVADGLVPPASSDSNVIKVADGVDGNNRLIRVADGVDGNNKLIKVADGQSGNKKLIKVAGGQDKNKKLIKVAGRQLVKNKKLVKVADSSRRNKKQVKVARIDSLETDVTNPEDNETRKVEAKIVMRDILGNITIEKISDLRRFADEQNSVVEEKPIWLEEF